MRVASVSPTVRSRLLSVSRRISEPTGAVLFRRNEPAFGVFLICKGSVSLRLEGEQVKSEWERTATVDSIVGLPGTLSGGKYSLTAVALENSDLAFVDRSALLDLIKHDTSVGLELMRALGKEVVQTREVLASVPHF
jgi:CRP/FNR family transcriptional regulator, polysaccharide utilization system transcription regulator